MTTRKSVIQTLGSVIILLSTATGGLLTFLWVSSQPTSSGTVQGASTKVVSTEITSYPTLAPYPEPLQTPTTIYAKEFALYNVDSGKIVTSSTGNQQVPIASTTKLMTSYLVTKNLNPETVLTVSPKAAGQIGSRMGLYAGEKITVKNLLYGLMLVSGNDAAYALAEAIGTNMGSTSEPVERFVTLMNNTAKELHVSNTSFKDPAGLNDEGHSTAKDLAKIFGAALQEPLIKEVMSTSDVTVTSENGRYSHVLHNSNRLLSDMPYPGIIGGKTGYTPKAGHCLTAAATRDGKTLIAVILHTNEDSKNASAIEARKLLDIGFSKTVWR